MADDNNFSAAAKSSEVSKKSFEYKVSKKVAELIQVVHMLFTKNHERELELQTTKDAYEQEIENVIHDARNRLNQLQQTLDDEKRRCEVRIKKVELDCSNKEKLLEKKANEASKKAKESDDRVATLTRLNNGLNEQLVQMQSELEALQKVNQSLSEKLQINTNTSVSVEDHESRLSAELSDCRTELDRNTAEIKKLHKNAVQFETQHLHYEQLIKKLKFDLNQQEITVKKDTDNLQRQLVEMTKGKEKLELKNKSLEIHLKKLKENERRSSLASSDPGPTSPTQGTNNVNVPNNSNDSLSDPREEVERLRREIQRYRMELYNREGNFNRMFTDSSPVRVSGRIANLGVSRSKTDMTMRASVPVGRKQQVHSVPNDSRLRPRFGQDRLPSLSMDFKQRTATRMEIERL